MFVGLSALAFTAFTISAIHLSVGNAIEAGSDRLGADAMVLPVEAGDDGIGILLTAGPTGFYMDSSVRDSLLEMEEVQSASAQLFIVSAPLSCCTVSDTVLVGFEPENDFTITPWLGERLEGSLSPDEVVAGGNILPEPGGRLRFYGEEFLVAGKLDPTGIAYIDSSVFIPMEGARRMIEGSAERAERALDIGPTKISAVMVRFREGVGQDEAAVKLQYRLPASKVILASEVLRSARQGLLVPMKSVLAAAVVQWVVGLVMVGALYALSISARRREIGLMRAMGAGRGHLIRLFLYEVLLLSAAAGAAGVTLGAGVLIIFKDLLKAFLSLPFLLPSVEALAEISGMVMFFTVSSASSATLYPIWKTSGQSPDEVLSETPGSRSY